MTRSGSGTPRAARNIPPSAVNTSSEMIRGLVRAMYPLSVEFERSCTAVEVAILLSLSRFLSEDRRAELGSGSV